MTTQFLSLDADAIDSFFPRGRHTKHKSQSVLSQPQSSYAVDVTIYHWLMTSLVPTSSGVRDAAWPHAHAVIDGLAVLVALVPLRARMVQQQGARMCL
jgi:hypothetical protein